MTSTIVEKTFTDLRENDYCFKSLVGNKCYDYETLENFEESVERYIDKSIKEIKSKQDWEEFKNDLLEDARQIPVYTKLHTVTKKNKPTFHAGTLVGYIDMKENVQSIAEVYDGDVEIECL